MPDLRKALEFDGAIEVLLYSAVPPEVFTKISREKLEEITGEEWAAVEGILTEEFGEELLGEFQTFLSRYGELAAYAMSKMVGELTKDEEGV